MNNNAEKTGQKKEPGTNEHAPSGQANQADFQVLISLETNIK